MDQRTLGIAIAIVALAGGACDFAPICPPNTQYDNGIRRCTVLDAGLDSGPAEEPDAGPTEEDAGGDDAGEEDGGVIDDAGSDDAGADDAGEEDAG